MKKLIAFILTALLMLNCVPVLAAETGTEPVGDWYIMWSEDLADGDIIVFGDVGWVNYYRFMEDNSYELYIVDWYNGGEETLAQTGVWKAVEDGSLVLHASNGDTKVAVMQEMTDPATGEAYIRLDISDEDYTDVTVKDIGKVYQPAVFGGYSQTAAEADFEGTWLLSGIEDFADDGGFYSAYGLEMDTWNVVIEDRYFNLSDDGSSGIEPIGMGLSFGGSDSEGDVYMYGYFSDGSDMAVYIDATGENIYVFGILEDAMMIFTKEGARTERPAVILEREALLAE